MRRLIIFLSLLDLSVYVQNQSNHSDTVLSLILFWGVVEREGRTKTPNSSQTKFSTNFPDGIPKDKLLARMQNKHRFKAIYNPSTYR